MKIIIEGSPKEIAALEWELKNGKDLISQIDTDSIAHKSFEIFEKCHVNPLVNIQNP